MVVLGAPVLGPVVHLVEGFVRAWWWLLGVVSQGIARKSVLPRLERLDGRLTLGNEIRRASRDSDVLLALVIPLSEGSKRTREI